MDFSALLKEEIRLTSSRRSQWTGQLGGKEVTLYSKPLTPADNHAVLAKFPNFNQSFDVAGMAMYIALKAETEDGKTAFSVGRDLPMLQRLGQDKIGEMFQAMFGSQIEQIDAEGDHHEERVGN